MLTIHRSNRVESLLEALAEVLAEPVGPPTVPEIIAVQSRGMETWLSMELSRRFGIWAGAAFPFPRALLEELFDGVLGEAEGTSFATESLPWSVLGALPDCLGRPGFEPLAAYLHEDRTGIKAYGLANRIAHVLDQYVVYRPEMLLAWEAGEDGGWQAELHRLLVSRRGEDHVAARAKAFVEVIQRGEAASDALPARLSLFGISTLPPLYVQVLAALPDAVEVHLFLLDPAGDSRADPHPLAVSLGGQAREFHDTITAAAAHAVDDARFEDPAADHEPTLLTRLQSAILHGSAARDALDPADESLAIHACHGPMREVEVLHDQLRHLLESDPTLEPHHVVVMTPNVEAYAPFLEAVFATADGDGDGIPFRISDRSEAATLPAVEAMRAVLALARSRATATEVLDLAATAAVRARFGLGHDDMDTLHEWVRQVGIRWGRDARHREAQGQPRTSLNTWRFGLDRWLLGHAMPDEQLFGGVLPEPVGDVALLDRFVNIAETLSAHLAELQEARPVEAWCRQLARTAAALFSSEGDLARGDQVLRDALASLARETEDAAFDAPVDLAVIQRHLGQRFERSSSTRAFLSGGITVCNLLPMRSIPFRVVCLLGMSYDSFPRTQRTTGFDRIAHEPRPGDRSTRADDRGLFLEAVLGAREHLLITYVGQGQRDNAPRPPSVLVSELLDAISDAVHLEEPGDDPQEALFERLVTRHPLQPFSPRYFDGEAGLFSYREGFAEGARCARGATGTIPPFLAGSLPASAEPAVGLAQLQRFYQAPGSWFLQRRLGVRLVDAVDSLDDREPVATSLLEDHGIGDWMLRHAVEGGDLEDYAAVVEARGVLPLGLPGRCKYAELRARIEPLSAAIRAATAGAELPPLVVDLPLAGARLTGQLGSLWPHTRVTYTHGKLKAKRRLRHWIDHLVLNCVAPDGYPRHSTFISRGETVEEPHVEVLLPLAGEARGLLAELMELFEIGQRVPLAFFPRSSAAFAQAVLECAPLEKAHADARRQWEPPNWGSMPGEGEDAELELLFRGKDPLTESEPAFEELALQVFEPMFAAGDGGTP